MTHSGMTWSQRIKPTLCGTTKIANFSHPSTTANAKTRARQASAPEEFTQQPAFTQWTLGTTLVKLPGNFCFWDELSLDRGILDAQTRSGFDERYNTLDVRYCLAERTEQVCKIGMSNTLLLAVVICVLIKTGQCIFVMIRFVLREDQNPLVTLGDAVDSLIRRPDLTTSHMCSLDMRDIQMNLGRNLKMSRTPKSYDDDTLEMEILHGTGKHELLAHMARQWRNETPIFRSNPSLCVATDLRNFPHGPRCCPLLLSSGYRG